MMTPDDETFNKKIALLRGIPGSGKSTYTKENLPGAVVASADHFFSKTGPYKFNAALLGKAHDECKKTFTDALDRGEALVVVDNTNVKVRDFSFYVHEARKRGYEVEIVRLECDPEVAAKRNTHGVPREACIRMAESLAASRLPDDFPPEKVVKTG